MTSKFHPIVTNVIDGFDKRRWLRKPTLIVIHHTGTGGKLLRLMNKIKRMALHTNIARYLGAADKAYVSAHFQIGYEGEITQIVDPRTHVAYHAGKSLWWDEQSRLVVRDCNGFSVGIELLGDGNVEPYSEIQINACVELVKALESVIPSLSRSRIAGHQHIAPERKVDPGKFFPWGEFQKKLGVQLKLTNWGRP